ncbi:MAG: OmpH family outer membrane protein [Bacteroidia bacterium]
MIRKYCTVLVLTMSLVFSACKKDAKTTENKTENKETTSTAPTTPSDSGASATNTATPTAPTTEEAAKPAEPETTPEEVAKVKAGTEKIGYVNVASIYAAMPEAKAIQDKLKTLYASKDQEFQGLVKSAQEKAQKYQENAHLFNDNERKTREEELMGMERKAQELQYNANNDLAKEEERMTAPLNNKITNAIEAVAKEQGFTYIMNDVGQMLYADKSRDVTALVKIKLGLKK